MCGSQTLMRQQKNTSFGAHEFRDGVSYNEQHHKQNLVTVEDLASLNVGECYTLLPEPKVRLSKMQNRQ
jgi:type IV secretory pathway TraG/TraD family ATPase VirD4